MPNIQATSPSLPPVAPPVVTASAGSTLDSCAIRAGLTSASADQAVYTQFPQTALRNHLIQQGLTPPGHDAGWLQLRLKPCTRMAGQDGAVYWPPMSDGPTVVGSPRSAGNCASIILREENTGDMYLCDPSNLPMQRLPDAFSLKGRLDTHLAAMSANGRFIAATHEVRGSSRENKVIVHDRFADKTVEHPHRGHVAQLSVDSSGCVVLAGSGVGRQVPFSPTEGNAVRVELPDYGLYRLSPDGQYILRNGAHLKDLRLEHRQDGHCISLVRPDAGTRSTHAKGMEVALRAIAFSQDNDMVATLSDDGMLDVFDLRGAKGDLSVEPMLHLPLLQDRASLRGNESVVWFHHDGSGISVLATPKDQWDDLMLMRLGFV